MTEDREAIIKAWAFQRYLRRLENGKEGTAEEDYRLAAEEYDERAEEQKWTRG